MTKMVGVDVGGTFTDVFVLDEATGVAEVAKVPTTRPDQSGGFLDGIGRCRRSSWNDRGHQCPA
jgi:N-methylhydantoinase A